MAWAGSIRRPGPNHGWWSGPESNRRQRPPKDIRRQKTTDSFQKEYSIWVESVVSMDTENNEHAVTYKYRRHGSRGPAPIVIVSSRHHDPRAAVEAVLGPLSMFTELVPADPVEEITAPLPTVKAPKPIKAKVVLGGGRVRLSGDADMLREWLSRPGVDPAILDVMMVGSV